MCKLHKIISISLAFIMLMAVGGVSVFALEGNYKNFATFSENCTFDGEFTFGTSNETIYVNNIGANNSISIGKENNNNFLEIVGGSGSCPYVLMYSGSDATADDVAIKFDYYVTSTSSKDKLTINCGGEKTLFWFDWGSLKPYNTSQPAVATYRANTWYNFECYTDKAFNSVKYRFKESSATEWIEGWVTIDGWFDNCVNTKLSNIKIANQRAASYTTRIDNYSHSQENVEDAPRPKLYKVFDRYAETVTFSETDDLSYYVETANISGNSNVTVAADPLNSENKALKLHADGSVPYVMPLNNSTDTGNSLHSSFDFYNPNGAKMMLRLVLEGGKQPLVLLFEDLFEELDIKMTTDKTPIVSDSGTSMTYTTDKWYTVSLDMNWKANYFKLGLKEKGADEYIWATVPFFTEFVNYTTDLKLVQIRLGYFAKPAVASDIYIDNYTHSTSSEIAATADVTKAIKPKAVKTTGDTVTSVVSHAMTLSGVAKPVKLLVALYDSEGLLSEIVMSEDMTCSTTEGTPLSVDLTGKTFSSWRGFVWRNLETLVPVDLIDVNNW